MSRASGSGLRMRGRGDGGRGWGVEEEFEGEGSAGRMLEEASALIARIDASDPGRALVSHGTVCFDPHQNPPRTPRFCTWTFAMVVPAPRVGTTPSHHPIFHYMCFATKMMLIRSIILWHLWQQGNMVCCTCGAKMQYNPSAMCAQCLKTRVVRPRHACITVMLVNYCNSQRGVGCAHLSAYGSVPHTIHRFFSVRYTKTF